MRLHWAAYGLISFLVALFLGWKLLAGPDFLYGVWYRVLAIDAHIAEHAPRNRYRPGFAQTTESERKRLFSAVVEAVHNNPENLRRIRYHSADGKPIRRLLRRPEIVHLQDVAALVKSGLKFGWVMLGIWALWSAALVAARARVPALRRWLMTGSIAAGVGFVTVLAIGPVRVFHAAHRWIFPPEHEWFFYYRDSLMSTLMKAPDLFGAIAATWLILILILWLAWAAALRRLANLSALNSAPQA